MSNFVTHVTVHSTSVMFVPKDTHIPYTKMMYMVKYHSKAGEQESDHVSNYSNFFLTLSLLKYASHNPIKLGNRVILCYKFMYAFVLQKKPAFTNMLWNSLQVYVRFGTQFL